MGACEISEGGTVRRLDAMHGGERVGGAEAPSGGGVRWSLSHASSRPPQEESKPIPRPRSLRHRSRTFGPRHAQAQRAAVLPVRAAGFFWSVVRHDPS